MLIDEKMTHADSRLLEVLHDLLNLLWNSDASSLQPTQNQTIRECLEYYLATSFHYPMKMVRIEGLKIQHYQIVDIYH